MTRQHASDASTSCFVAMAVVGMLAIGAAVLLWQVSVALAVMTSLLLWPSLGWIAAVTATRVRFGRAMSLRLMFSLLVATVLRLGFLLLLSALSFLLALGAVAATFLLTFAVTGTEPLEGVEWLVPLAASSILLLIMAFAARHILWPLVREFWGVDTGEWCFRTDRPRFLFDELRGVREGKAPAEPQASIRP